MENFVTPQDDSQCLPLAELIGLPEWQALAKHQHAMATLHLRDLFKQDTQRFENFSLKAAGLFLDYSKNRVNKQTFKLLFALAEARGVSRSIEGLFTGQKVNTSEQRPALHTALRQQDSAPLYINNQDIIPEIQNTYARMNKLVQEIHQPGQKFTDLIHIGIGGSDLGPRMMTKALKSYQTGVLACHFVSHMDGKLISTLLKTLDPKTSLVVIASKSFKTKEVLSNANIAKTWLLEAAGKRAAQSQLLAVTAYPEKAIEWGVNKDLVFPLWNWVGGRFSLWSAMGLSLALAIGMDNFNKLRAGAACMDQHFQKESLESNMPVILALLDIWYVNFYGVRARVVLPYEEALSGLPAHLQQLEMESNGKRVNCAGLELDYATAPLIFGGLGGNAQHAFLQLLYQGKQLIPADFIVTAATHPIQLANCLGQARALAFGKTQEEALVELLMQCKNEEEARCLAAHQSIPGNNPSNIICMLNITPESMGALVALYEHKVFVEGVIWGINSFDQWGIELGKQFAEELLMVLDRTDLGSLDSSTQGLINYYQNNINQKNNGK